MSTPIPLTVVRWQCPHCGRARSKKAATVDHIGRCWSNPNVRACRTCVNYEITAGPCGDYYCNCPPSEEVCRADVDLSDGVMRTGCPKWEAAA